MLSGNHTGEGSYRVFELPKLSPADVRSCQIRLFSYSSATTATVPSLLEMLQCVLSARFVICQPDDPTSQSLASFWLTAFDSREVSRFVTSHDPGCGSAAFRLSIELGALDYLRDRKTASTTACCAGRHLRTTALTAAPATIPATPANRTLPPPYVGFVVSVVPEPARFAGERVSAH